jgi:glycosyltransferase involved in cell wall biosynthesis
MKIRVCHVLSDVDQSHLIETHGEMMDKARYDIGFVFLGKRRPQLFDFFRERNYFVRFFEFNGAKSELPRAVFRLRKVFKEFQPDIVHTHLVEASLTGLIAAKTLGIKRRIHTRHHGVEAHTYYPRGVYYDKIINRLSKKIIAISRIVADALTNLEKVAPEKVTTIPHGFDLENFTASEQKVQELKQKYELENHYPVIGSIARFIHWKGVQNTIPAFVKILEKYPHAKLVLANATGPYKEEIHALLKNSLDEKRYVVIEFERSVFALYKTFDAFVHVPVNRDFEAFGQVFIESLAMEVPSVFSLAGVANDFIKDKENALVVPYDDAEAIAKSLNLILGDEELRRKIVKKGREDVWRMFHQTRFGAQLDALYTELMA